MGATVIQIMVMVVMITATMSVVSTSECSKLDLQIWNYESCPHPQSNEWNSLKEKMNCDNSKDLYYHCASDIHGCDVQLCQRREYCQAGSVPLLNPSKDTAVCVPCPPDRYQTLGFWSNERSYCEHEKTKCDGDGQIECQPGSTTTDRSCRCNVHENFVLENYALSNATCCTENDQLCYCVKVTFPCSNGTVRHDNYRCMEQCPPNSFRRWDSDKCYPDSSSQKYETSTAQTPHQDSQIPTGIIIGLVVTTAALITASVLIYCLKCRQESGQNAGEIEAPPIFQNGDSSNPHRDSNEAPETVKLLQEENDSSTTKDRIKKKGAEAPETVKLLPEEKVSSGTKDRKKKKDADNGHITKIKIHAPGAIFNIDGENNAEVKYFENVTQIAPESHGASSLSTEENLVSVNPEESRHEESSLSDETSMDTEPKKPVEHEDIPPDETRLKNLPYPSQVEADDQTKRKEVWSPTEVVPDDQTKRKEVWSPPKVVPDDQTKRKEVRSPTEVVPDDQTKRKEVWSPPKVVPDDQTKCKEVRSPTEVVPDDQTKPKVLEPDEQEESEDSSQEDVEETKVKEV